MGALFTGADVAQKMFADNFTTLEKTKIAPHARPAGAACFARGDCGRISRMDFETLIAALGGKLGVELDGTGGACGLERLDADGALLFVDRFAETAVHWKTLLADYRPAAPGAASAAPATATAPDAPGAFLPV